MLRLSFIWISAPLRFKMLQRDGLLKGPSLDNNASPQHTLTKANLVLSACFVTLSISLHVHFYALMI